jgi:AcrR family transcriptional regulator
MPTSRGADTRARIQAVALELFAERGLPQTSLRDIAERLGVTKAALYYHFASREELVASLVRPLVDDFDAYVADREAQDRVDPRALLESYFDLSYKHRRLVQVAIHDLTVLQQLDLVPLFTNWRERLITLLVGPEADVAQQVRGVVALGGLSDCVVGFDEVSPGVLRTAAVDAAYDALSVG